MSQIHFQNGTIIVELITTTPFHALPERSATSREADREKLS
jgi:hypothetical protein